MSQIYELNISYKPLNKDKIFYYNPVPIRQEIGFREYDHVLHNKSKETMEKRMNQKRESEHRLRLMEKVDQHCQEFGKQALLLFVGSDGVISGKVNDVFRKCANPYPNIKKALPDICERQYKKYHPHGEKYNFMKTNDKDILDHLGYSSTEPKNGLLESIPHTSPMKM